MKIFTELTYFAATASAPELRERVRQLEDAGSSGISFWDHVFTDDGKAVCDPLTTLAAIGAMSPTLELQTVVMNAAWLHPALLLRQFSQLAVLVGGDRVTAGLGAGWSIDEFAALAMPYPSAPERVSRLRDVLSIASQLYKNKVANESGGYWEAHDLPLNPAPETPPQILVGARGDRMIRLAAKFADKVDFIGSPHVPRLGTATTMGEQHDQGQSARGRTTIEILQERVGLLRDLTEKAGRPRDSVKVCVQVNNAVVTRNKAETEAVDKEICEKWFKIPEQSLAENPYTLRGEPQQIADTLADWKERLGLTQVTVQENQDATAFCAAVTPLLN